MNYLTTSTAIKRRTKKMSKKMTPLQAFRIMVKDNDLKLPYHNTIQAVETALKDHEKITGGDFHIEPINVHIENQNKIKAFEIVVEKNVNIFFLKTVISSHKIHSIEKQVRRYNEYCIDPKNRLTEEEYKLLKEII